MPNPLFVSEQELLDLHDDLLEEHGGPPGHNHDLVCSIAAYPQQKFSYGDPPPDIAEIGASYGFAACKFHAFTDGNKRVALAGMAFFLKLNGYELTTDDAENRDVILELASGAIGEEDFTAWVKASCAAV